MLQFYISLLKIGEKQTNYHVYPDGNVQRIKKMI